MKIVRLATLCAACAGILALPELAGAAYEVEQNNPTVRSLGFAAQQGEPRALYQLGLLYKRGNGVPKDSGTALHWFELAAKRAVSAAQFELGTIYGSGPRAEDHLVAVRFLEEAARQGLAKAQYSLGLIYEQGKTLPRNAEEAATWYRRAAEQGDAKAQYRLGTLYYKGLGLPRDDAAAIEWFRRAADQDIPEAQYNAGLMYARGEGVPTDNIRAHVWFALAASQGYDEAIKGLDITASFLDPDQMAEAERLSRDWRPQQNRFRPIGLRP
jgi:TPR repeat protein